MYAHNSYYCLTSPEAIIKCVTDWIFKWIIESPNIPSFIVFMDFILGAVVIRHERMSLTVRPNVSPLRRLALRERARRQVSPPSEDRKSLYKGKINIYCEHCFWLSQWTHIYNLFAVHCLNAEYGRWISNVFSLRCTSVIMLTGERKLILLTLPSCC